MGVDDEQQEQATERRGAATRGERLHPGLHPPPRPLSPGPLQTPWGGIDLPNFPRLELLLLQTARSGRWSTRETGGAGGSSWVNNPRLFWFPRPARSRPFWRIIEREKKNTASAACTQLVSSLVKLMIHFIAVRYQASPIIINGTKSKKK